MHWGNNQRSMLTLSRKGQNIRCDFDRFGRRRVNMINYETTCSNMDNYMRGEGNFEVEPLSELRCSCRSIPLSVFNAKKENTRGEEAWFVATRARHGFCEIGMHRNDRNSTNFQRGIVRRTI